MCFLYLLSISTWTGWILIDRSGTHFGTILSYLREGTVTLVKGKQAVLELLAEAKYYLIQGLVELCQNNLQVIVNIVRNNIARVCMCMHVYCPLTTVTRTPR